ncbi:MAG: LTA synthase family protein [Myxococcales bacterium]|nr:LTA synthase family protein [Myxococcales bacterium]
MTPEPIGRASLLRTALLMGALSLGILGAKLHKLLRTGGASALADLGPVFARDLLLLGGLSLLFVVILDRGPRSLRWVPKLLVHTLFVVIATLAGAEHAHFLATGAVADGYMFDELLERAGELVHVVASEITWPRALSMATPVIYSVGVFLFLRQRERARSSEGTAPSPTSWRSPLPIAVLSFTVGALVIGSVFFGAVPTPNRMVLRRNFLVGLLSDLHDLRTAPREGPPVEIDPIQPLVLEKGPGPRRNLLVITLESVSAKATSITGENGYARRVHNTPFLEELAARGLRVDRAYTVIPHTTKALVAIHCGTYPKFTPKVAEAKEGGIPVPCLPRLLREEGYATAFFQPAEENYENRRQLIEEFGFEHFAGKESISGKGFDEASYFGWEDNALVEPVAAWIRRQKRPYFAAVLTLTAHHPYAVPKGFPVEKYVSDPDLNDYLNTVRYTDVFLRKLIGRLEGEGLLEDTIVIISGDHGEAFGEHGRFQHDTAVYEENVRVPLVVFGPGVEESTRATGLRQLTDILPTALDLLGFVPSRPVLGRSLLFPEGHDQLFMQCYFLQRCQGLLRDHRKVVDNFARRTPEVYDLAEDPFEQRDLYQRDPGVRESADKDIRWMRTLVAETNARYDVQAESRVAAFVGLEKPRVGRTMRVNFGAIELVESRIVPTEIEPGDSFTVTQVYRVTGTPNPATRPFLHVVGEEKMFNGDHEPVGGAYPVSRWKTGQYIQDRFVFATRPDYPVGRYQIRSGFWRPGEGRLKPVSVDTNVDEEDRVLLGTVDVRPAAIDAHEFVSTTMPSMETNRNVRFGDVMRLVHTSIDKPSIKGGLKTTVTAVYEVLSEPPGDLEMEIRIAGKTSRQVAHEPVLGRHPPSAWRKGQFITDRIEIITQTSDSTGLYEVGLALLRSGERLKVEGEEVNAKSLWVPLATYSLRNAR